MIQFQAVLEQSGKTATGIVVPPSVVESLGAGKRPAVRVTVQGHTYRTTIATMAGDFMIPVSAENRAAAGVKAGDRLDVDVELDSAPREIPVPADLEAAMDVKAKDFFNGLSNSRKQSYTLWIESAKKPETREKRVAEAVAMLRAGRPQR